MKVTVKDFFGVKRGDKFRLLPFGDIHLGAEACDESRFNKFIEYAKETGSMLIGMGDYCDFIQMSDPRFASGSLANWITMKDLADISGAQRDRFLKKIEPVAGQVVTMLEGNHEKAITKHYERKIYYEMVAGVAQMSGTPIGDLHLGYNGWLVLNFYQDKKNRAGNTRIIIYLHHGFVGGRLAGAKALNMQRVLHTHEADIVLMGHSHNTSAQIEQTIGLGQTNKITHNRRYGAYTGSFLKSEIEEGDTYSEIKGYLPMPLGGTEILLQPAANSPEDRIKIITY